MRNLLLLLMLGMVAFAGCLDSDDPAPADDDTEDETPAPADEPAEENFGDYVLELATGLCHATDYEEPAPGSYVSTIGGGTWAIRETNGVPGLQYENNHPTAGTGAGFDLPVDERCVDGDQVVA